MTAPSTRLISNDRISSFEQDAWSRICPAGIAGNGTRRLYIHVLPFQCSCTVNIPQMRDHICPPIGFAGSL